MTVLLAESIYVDVAVYVIMSGRSISLSYVTTESHTRAWIS